MQLKPHPPKSAHMACHALWNLSFPKYVTDGSTPTDSLIKKAKSKCYIRQSSVTWWNFFGRNQWVFQKCVLGDREISKRAREVQTHTHTHTLAEREREQQDILSLWLLAGDFCMSCCSHSGQCSCSALRTEACNWDKLCHDLWIDEASVNTKKSLFLLWGKFSFQLFFLFFLFF